jgi:putative hydrolase of the HAD superfamily
MADFVRAVRGADPEAAIRPEALAAIATAKAAGKRLAILSNELDLFYDVAFRRQLPWLADFEVIHDATHTGILKPDAAAYRDCLATLGLPAEACVFVDDQPRNVAGADAVGLKTVAFDVRRPAASFDRALELLGLKEFSHA